MSQGIWATALGLLVAIAAPNGDEPSPEETIRAILLAPNDPEGYLRRGMA